MTGPLGGGGRTISIPANGQAVLLTETAVVGTPVFLINTSADSLLYIGDSSAVGPSSGVPLEASTALPWSAGGTVWAAAAPGTADAVSLVITSAIDGWDPSPAAIAAAVAAELLAQGIPNVLVEEPIVNGITLAPGATTNPPTNVSGFASLVIFSEQMTPTVSERLLATQMDPNGNAVDTETISLPAFKGSARLAVTGTTIQFTNQTTDPVRIWVVGSNRAAVQRLDVRAKTSLGDVWTSPSAAYTVGQLVALTEFDNTVQLQGQCYLDFRLGSTAAALKGGLSLVKADGNAYNLAAAGELVLNSANQLCVTKLVAVPASAYTLNFVCTAAGTGTVAASLTPC